ncbi:toll/interleukin-1 receptor domain-containing protein [Nocardia sp. alder85J]|uniref:toll/interleukin-1 receptor domain-containing protein n=1 Tax=Nocardia sp. alder85J TaxID=2862949 RepID=UPI001CD7DF32|nr:toll/interleukin-1 receptor domain-containing protein [Nocardia sp. alder85J]MCX4094630.1 toll/interleukin-1 receptor domain-containing protein [Nocardia sp. alder85J]
MHEPVPTGGPRVFISYANDHGPHAEAVIRLWRSLIAHGIGAYLDVEDQDNRQDWPLWMQRQIDAADYVIVVASTAYRDRAEQRIERGVGRGVAHESAYLRELVYENPGNSRRFLPVLLPGETPDGIPAFLGRYGGTRYELRSFTAAGLEPLLRALTNQPKYPRPPLGTIPALPPARDPGPDAPPDPGSAPATRRAPGPSAQSVTGSTVHGSVVQIRNVNGSVRFTRGGGPVGIPASDLPGADLPGAEPPRMTAVPPSPDAGQVVTDSRVGDGVTQLDGVGGDVEIS